MKPTSKNSVITDTNMRRNRFEPQDATHAKPARESLFILSIGRKLHDTIVSGLKPLHKTDVSFNFVWQDVISGLWFSEKLQVIILSKLRLIGLLVQHWCKEAFRSYTLFQVKLTLISDGKTDSVFDRFHRTTHSKEHLSNERSRGYTLHCPKESN